MFASRSPFLARMTAGIKKMLLLRHNAVREAEEGRDHVRGVLGEDDLSPR